MPSLPTVPGRTPQLRTFARCALPNTLSRTLVCLPQLRAALPVQHGMLVIVALLICALLPSYAAAAPPAEGSAAPVSEDVAAIARKYVGAPYRYGGAGPRSFDCSGLTMFVFGQVGVRLPHNAAAQYNTAGQRIRSMSELAPGDLVFFARTTGRRGITHAAVYVGDGMMVSANTPRTGVQLNSIHSGYWSSHFAGGVRVYR